MTTAPTSPALPSRRNLTEAEWAEAKALLETGRMTKTELAAKYGVSKQAISQGLNARGAVYGSKSKIVEEATIQAQREDASKRIEEIQAFKEKQRKMVEMVQNLTIKAVTDQIRTGKPLGDIDKDLGALNRAMKNLQAGRNELYHLYDLYRDPDADSEIEEFIVSEYSQDEIRALNKERLGIDVDADLKEIAESLENQDAGELDALLSEMDE